MHSENQRPQSFYFKKYKGKLCAYCCKELSVTADHVFAKEFFLIDKRDNLPKVPSCKQCNNDKSEIEHYLTALLPFGGRHKDSRENLKKMVPKRLRKNPKLHKELATEKDYILTNGPSGSPIPSMVLPINFESIPALFKYIVKGLANYYWDVYLNEDVSIEVMSLTPAGEQFYEERFFRLNCKARVIETLGENTFWYEGVQGVDRPEITAWRFSVYNGLQLTGDPEASAVISSVIGAHSGPKYIFENAIIKAKLNKRLDGDRE
jgi:hypothetical protein